MDVWVRKQDKTRLRKISDLNYDFCHIIAFGINSPPMHCVYDGDSLLGTYPTEERCLEIIDEIQGLLMGSQMLIFKDLDVTGAEMEYLKPFKGVMYKVGNEPNISVNQLDTVVYEMPQE